MTTYMKKAIFFLNCFFIYLSLAIITACSSNSQPNGWYHLNETGEEITGDAIITVKDFEAIEFDKDETDGKGIYIILGSIKPEKKSVFADATEKAIGKQIGFLYNGELLTKPMVNSRIEGGNFMITFLDDYTYKQAEEIFNKLQEEMK